MRIHRIRLRNYRGVADREIRFETSGVTIIEGDNEAGKSSLAEAIDLLLEERDDTSKAKVKAVKPIDRDAGAEVEAEISAGEYHFVYAKRWHRDRFTTLEIIEPHHEQMTGREAHERVAQILTETVDVALWHALRVAQGVATEQPTWGIDSSLARALDVAAGGSPDTGQGSDLYTRVCEERNRDWTSTGKPNAERTRLDKALADAEAEVDSASGALHALEADVTRHENLTRELADLRPKRDELMRDLEAMERKWQAIEQRRAKVNELAAAAEASATSLSRAQDAVSAREALVAEVERRRVALQDTVEEQQRSEPALAATLRSVEGAERQLEEARAMLPSAAADSERAAADLQHLRDLFDLETLSERHGRVCEAEQRIARADEQIAGCRVDDSTLDKLETAQTQVTGKQAALDASAGVLRSEALREVTLRIGSESLALSEGQADERPIAGELEILVGDYARIVVIPGGDARLLGSELADARENLAHLCRSAHVSDLADARRQHRERNSAEEIRSGEVKRRSENLRDLTLEEMAAKVERLESATASYRSSRIQGTPLPDGLSAAQRIAADASAALDDLREAIARHELHLESVKKTRQERLLDQSGLAERQKASQQELDDALKRLDDARREAPDQDLARAADSADADADAARNLHDEAARALELENPGAQEVLLSNKKAANERTTKEIRGHEDDLNAVEARLEVRGEEGLQRLLDEAVTRQVALRHEKEQRDARAAAAKLLHATMNRHRDAAKQRYLTPFRERIEGLARVVFGPELEVELDDDLRIARRTLDGKTLDWAQLSIGAREQLAMIARLACAAIVSDDGGVPVIFDDALGNTDPGRLERMGAVLSMATAGSQVVILTCMPDRYRHVGNAAVTRIQN